MPKNLFENSTARNRKLVVWEKKMNRSCLATKGLKHVHDTAEALGCKLAEDDALIIWTTSRHFYFWCSLLIPVWVMLILCTLMPEIGWPFFKKRLSFYKPSKVLNMTSLELQFGETQFWKETKIQSQTHFSVLLIWQVLFAIYFFLSKALTEMELFCISPTHVGWQVNSSP